MEYRQRLVAFGIQKKIFSVKLLVKSFLCSLARLKNNKISLGIVFHHLVTCLAKKYVSKKYNSENIVMRTIVPVIVDGSSLCNVAPTSS